MLAAEPMSRTRGQAPVGLAGGGVPACSRRRQATEKEREREREKKGFGTDTRGIFPGSFGAAPSTQFGSSAQGAIAVCSLVECFLCGREGLTLFRVVSWHGVSQGAVRFQAATRRSVVRPVAGTPSEAARVDRRRRSGEDAVDARVTLPHVGEDRPFVADAMAEVATPSRVTAPHTTAVDVAEEEAAGPL